MAQQLSGHYKLRGIQDMAAGFEFKGDSFYFYCYYGAIDRFAEGTYTQTGNTIVLHSSKVSGDDFIVTKTNAANGVAFIQVKDPNPYLAEYTVCIIQRGGATEYVQANAKGQMLIHQAKDATLYLKHQLYADIPMLLKAAGEAPAAYEVRLKPSLQQVSFKGIDLTISADGSLRWLPNYFIDAVGVWFEKITE
ncbi:MAG TPA: hypothetical protein PKC39_12230 [Ferruginibacter sp.]|nr:hypothetical protein [Ferruginibacter sp.]